MDLNLLHTISGILLVLSFGGKLLLHFYLDRQHDRAPGIVESVLAPSKYFRLYNTVVTPHFNLLKQVANLLLLVAAASLVLNIVVGVLLLM